MSQRNTRRRAAALKAAREAQAETVAKRLARERETEAALADYFEGASAAEGIRREARERAERIVAAAEERASKSDARAAHAVRTLRTLGQTNAEIAALCGISVAMVRVMTVVMTVSEREQNQEPPGSGNDRGSPQVTWRVEDTEEAGLNDWATVRDE